MKAKIGRIARLVRAEGLKALSHPFLAIAIVLMVGVIVASVLLQGGGGSQSGFSRANAIQLFSSGMKFGFQFVAFYVIIFAAMSFAGEYDRGTMKGLLTRPITRTELFLAKSIFLAILTFVLLFIVMYVSILMGLLTGDLGPVWDAEHYTIHLTYDELLDRTWTILLITLCSPLAAAFLGLLISNLTENSGYAVATALVLYSAIQIGQTFLGENEKKYLFTFFPGQALDVLSQYSGGTKTFPLDALHALVPYSLLVPAATVLFFGLIAYLRFRWKNVHS